MAKKLGEGRKVGTGHFLPRPVNPIKGCYKIYFITSVQDPFIRFVLYTKDYSYNVLQRYIHLAKRNCSSRMDKWIIERLAMNDKIKMIEQNFYPLNTIEKEVKEQVNTYIEKYKDTILNERHFTFIGPYKPKGKIITQDKIDEIKQLSLTKNFTSKEIATKLNITKGQVDYWVNKLGTNKHTKMKDNIILFQTGKFNQLSANQLRYIKIKLDKEAQINTQDQS